MSNGGMAFERELDGYNLLIVGCGGTGCDMTRRILAYQKTRYAEGKAPNTHAILLDTDKADLELFEKALSALGAGVDTLYLDPRIETNLHYLGRDGINELLRIGGLADRGADGEWRPNPAAIKKAKKLVSHATAARQTPAFSRMPFALGMEKFKRLLQKVWDEALNRDSRSVFGKGLRIVVIGSSFGGTGAGTILPAMYAIRDLVGKDCDVDLLMFDCTFAGARDFNADPDFMKRAQLNTLTVEREIDIVQSEVLYDDADVRNREPILPPPHGTPNARFDNVYLYGENFSLASTKNPFDFDDAKDSAARAFVDGVILERVNERFREQQDDFELNYDAEEFVDPFSGSPRIYRSQNEIVVKIDEIEKVEKILLKWCCDKKIALWCGELNAEVEVPALPKWNRSHFDALAKAVEDPGALLNRTKLQEYADYFTANFLAYYKLVKEQFAALKESYPGNLQLLKDYSDLFLQMVTLEVKRTDKLIQSWSFDMPAKRDACKVLYAYRDYLLNYVKTLMKGSEKLQRKIQEQPFDPGVKKNAVLKNIAARWEEAAKRSKEQLDSLELPEAKHLIAIFEDREVAAFEWGESRLSQNVALTAELLKKGMDDKSFNAFYQTVCDHFRERLHAAPELVAALYKAQVRTILQERCPYFNLNWGVQRRGKFRDPNLYTYFVLPRGKEVSESILAALTEQACVFEKNGYRNKTAAIVYLSDMPEDEIVVFQEITGLRPNYAKNFVAMKKSFDLDSYLRCTLTKEQFDYYDELEKTTLPQRDPKSPYVL